MADDEDTWADGKTRTFSGPGPHDLGNGCMLIIHDDGGLEIRGSLGCEPVINGWTIGSNDPGVAFTKGVIG